MLDMAIKRCHMCLFLMFQLQEVLLYLHPRLILHLKAALEDYSEVQVVKAVLQKLCALTMLSFQLSISTLACSWVNGSPYLDSVSATNLSSVQQLISQKPKPGSSGSYGSSQSS